ncbi:MAG TPA: zf-HC2 domain-containing protein [Chthonomonadaceae bacterium]|nr:zf-HC2 domain-containing protein [Chthonomonadaceae bacterium]
MWPKQHAEEAPASCAWTQDRLLGYLDGDLAPRETQRLRAHLDGCPACQQELALCRKSERLLATALSTAPPAGDLRSGFYARLAASSPSPRRAARSGWIAASALAGVILVTVLFVPRFHPSSRSAAVVTAIPLPSAPIADRRRDLAFFLAALPSPAPVASRSEPHVSEPRSAAARYTAARIAHRLPGRARWQAAFRRAPLTLARADRLQPPGTHATETIDVVQREAKTRNQVALLTAKTVPENTPTARLIPADDEVDFSVRDDVRGFTAGSHVSSLPAAPNGDHVLIIEEKSDSLPASAGDRSRSAD